VLEDLEQDLAVSAEAPQHGILRGMILHAQRRRAHLSSPLPSLVQRCQRENSTDTVNPHINATAHDRHTPKLSCTQAMPRRFTHHGRRCRCQLTSELSWTVSISLVASTSTTPSILCGIATDFGAAVSFRTTGAAGSDAARAAAMDAIFERKLERCKGKVAQV